jgi:hypothetical protein
VYGVENVFYNSAFLAYLMEADCSLKKSVAYLDVLTGHMRASKLVHKTELWSQTKTDNKSE